MFLTLSNVMSWYLRFKKLKRMTADFQLIEYLLYTMYFIPMFTTHQEMILGGCVNSKQNKKYKNNKNTSP